MPCPVYTKHITGKEPTIPSAPLPTERPKAPRVMIQNAPPPRREQLCGMQERLGMVKGVGKACGSSSPRRIIIF